MCDLKGMVKVSRTWSKCQGHGRSVKVMVEVSREMCDLKGMVKGSRAWPKCQGHGQRVKDNV